MRRGIEIQSMTHPSPKCLYNPKDIESSPTIRFLRQVNSLHGLDLQSYHDLFNWSTTHLDAFWSLVWDQTHVVGEKGSNVVDNNASPSQNPPWYASNPSLQGCYELSKHF